MPKFWIRYGLRDYGEWEEVEATSIDEAEDAAYRLAMEEAEMEVCCEAIKPLANKDIGEI